MLLLANGVDKQHTTHAHSGPNSSEDVCTEMVINYNICQLFIFFHNTVFTNYTVPALSINIKT